MNYIWVSNQEQKTGPQVPRPCVCSGQRQGTFVLVLIKHNSEMYGGVEVKLHAFLASELKAINTGLRTAVRRSSSP